MRILLFNCNNKPSPSLTGYIHANALLWSKETFNMHFIGGSINDFELPLFYSGIKCKGSEDVNALFSSCDAFILFFSEYHGAIPAATKNLLEHLSISSLAGKNAFLSCCVGGRNSFNACINLTICLNKMQCMVFHKYQVFGELYNKDNIVCFKDLHQRLKSFYSFLLQRTFL